MTRLIDHRPWAVLATCVLLLVVMAAGLPRLSINSDTRVFFSKDNVHRQALDAFEARFASNVNLLIALHTEEGDVFAGDRPAIIDSLTEAAWQLPYAIRVESIANATHISSDEEGIVIAPMTDAPNASALQAQVMADNQLVNRLVAADEKTTAINVVVQYPMNSSTITDEILTAAKTIVAEAGVEDAGFDVWYGGRVASSNAFSTASKTDLKTLLPLCFLTLYVGLIILLRSFGAASALFLTALFAAISTMGVAGWFGFQINAATAQVPTVIIALGVAALSHLVLSFQRKRVHGQTKRAAISGALRSDAKPIALTIGTTCLGFLTLNMADAQPFRDFGTLIAFGAFLCLVFGLTMLPCLLRLLPVTANAPQPLVGQMTSAANQFIQRHHNRMVLIGPIAFIVAVAGIAKIVIDDRFPSYFTEDYAFRQHTDLIEKHLTGVEVIEFDVGGEGPDAIYDQAYIERLAAFESWLADQPKVIFTSSILEIYRRLNQHLTDGAPENHLIPEDREALAQYILLYEMSLPLGQDLTNAISMDKSHSRVTAIMQGATTADIRRLLANADAWLVDEGTPALQGNAAGLAVMFAFLSSLNIEAMIGGTALALILISGILVLAFRSVRYGALSLIPNLLPGAAAFGLWGYLFGEVGVAVATVGALTLGIIVDDTVHMIWRYREARRRGDSAASSITHVFDTVGPPMAISTLVLVTGFAILGLSGFHITSAMGLLTAMTVGLALIADWGFFAPLLIALDKRREARAAQRGPVLVVENEPSAGTVAPSPAPATVASRKAS